MTAVCARITALKTQTPPLFMKRLHHYSIGLLCLISGGCSQLTDTDTTVPLEQLKKTAEAQRDDMALFLSKTIQYASVEDFGYQLKPETEALMQFALSAGTSMGFKSRREANGLVGVLEYGEGKESVGVLIHLDVAPVPSEEAPQWTYPPFSGQITAQEVWGRGAQDDKGALASVLWGAKLLIDGHATFNRKLVIILGTKEEKNFEDLTTYFNQYPQDRFGPTFGFVPDGAYIAQGEKGIADIDYTFADLSSAATQRDTIVGWSGGTAINAVADFSYMVIRSQDAKSTRAELDELIEQVNAELKTGISPSIYGLDAAYEAHLAVQDYPSFVAQHGLKDVPTGDWVLYSTGKGAHGSSPWLGKNAIMEVALVGARLGHVQDNGYLHAFRFITEKIGVSTDASGLGIPFIASNSLPIVPHGMDSVQYEGTSANVGLVKTNADDVTLSIDFRTGFENSNQQIMAQSQKAAAGYQGTAIYQSSVGSHYEAVYYGFDEPLLKLAVSSYKEVNPAYPPETPYLFLTPTTTYLKLVNNFVNFGPVDLYPDHTANYFHDKNERITIKSLVGNATLYAYTLQKMLQMDKAPLRKQRH